MTAGARADRGRSAWRTRWPVLSGLVTVVLVAAAVTIVLIAVPKVIDAFRGGNPWWALLAVLCTAGSLAGFCLAFHGTYRGRGNMQGRDSAEAALTQKGAATFVPGGQAGAAAVTGVVLRRTGMSAEELADRAVALLVLVHAPYLLGILVVGLLVGTGAVETTAPDGFIWTATAVAGGIVVAALLVARFVGPVPASAAARAERSRRARAAAFVHSAAGGVRSAISLMRSPEAVLGTLVYVTLDCATLLVCMRVFDEDPGTAAVIMAFLMAQIASLIPVPGGVGTVETGIVGTLVAFGASASAMAAPTFAYRVITLALPAISGGVAYLLLRRRLGSEAGKEVTVRLAPAPDR